ncbi:M3 family metallopeptidase [Litoreibacter roseus]|uniref:Peptidyl-dipeptidase Dcp n=1 Tax=Litoreibacter roseus TaxID=2601869 RepID=A0A6N6JB54_9RHOB|nr:M3 family metallopeptidase [Litoreibacter roseus]GFE63366.1 peptidyl-dipeptidase Dcp [Litoreibacter roseus]
MTNPLLSDWTTRFNLPPFSDIKDSHFEEGLDAALTTARAELTAIANNPEPATFDNTINALALMGEDLDKVLVPFYTLASTDSTPEREALQRDFSPLLSAWSSEVMMNRALFERVDTLWNCIDDLNLSDEERRVLDLSHRNFVRAGAKLEGDAYDRLKEVQKRLAVLGTEFTQNILADERSWSMALTDDDLEGLPDFVKASAIAAGKERDADGPVVTLSRSLIVPFLQFSSRRDLRERAYRAWTSRGANGGETDNREIAAEILQLRAERAQLLGYSSFADYKLEIQMAKTPDAVRGLLMDVWHPAKAQAERDAEVLTRMMHEDRVNGDLEPWDWRYYSRQRRAVEHDLDEAELKSYLQLDNMIEAAFDCATRLFDLEFSPIDVSLHHPDARAWEVTRGGKHIAVFVGDYFARAGKRSGAWCSAMRSQQKLKGDIRPHVLNVCNFAKPSGDAPALLSYGDARTLFHEFGHALHQMLSDVTYEMISGTSVARDFVELPSQLYEHWLEVPEVLQKHALHAETGAPMPDELLKRLLDAATYDQGFATVEYVASALVDLDFHTGTPPADPMARQTDLLEELGMPHAIGMRHATPHFAHVFSGDGYSAGYYSYMWSEVMDADAFEAFEEAGGAFDEETADKLEKFILSTGGSQEAEDLYLAFRGRMPGVEALLKGRGLAA